MIQLSIIGFQSTALEIRALCVEVFNEEQKNRKKEILSKEVRGLVSGGVTLRDVIWSTTSNHFAALDTK